MQKLESKSNITHIICDNLLNYVVRAKQHVAEVSKDNNDISMSPLQSSTLILPNKTVNHSEQIDIRLSLLKFVLEEGQLVLGENDARTIWGCLISSPVFAATDRNIGFKFFVEILSYNPICLHKKPLKSVFENEVLSLDPSSLNDLAFECLEKFLKLINCLENNLFYDENANKFLPLAAENYDLIGQDYLYCVILKSDGNISNRAINLLIELCGKWTHYSVEI